MLGVAVSAKRLLDATPGAAPADAVAEVSACAHVTEDRCTLPNGGRPLQHVAFPDIKDWSLLKISLRRTTV